MFVIPEKMTPISVYLLGLIWSDGHLGVKYSVTITCVTSDLKQLDSLITQTGNWGIFYRQPKGNRQPQQTFYISDKILYQFLENHGYKKKSTEPATKILNLIPPNLQKYWWRGFLDGDGCIFSKTGYQVFFTSSLNQDWSFFSKLPFFLDWKWIRKETPKGSYSRMLLWNKPDCLILLEYIYDGYDLLPLGYERKYQGFLKFRRVKKRRFVGKGYYLNKRVNKWCARINLGGKVIALGYFFDENEARKAVENARNNYLMQRNND